MAALKQMPISFMDLIYAYANLRGIADKTDRDHQMLGVIEPRLYEVIHGIGPNTDPQYLKLMEVIKLFTDGDMDGSMKLMEELSKSQEPK